jgi:predicted O-linked N-acetylglucosamine transferase (SPINDLY family)
MTVFRSIASPKRARQGALLPASAASADQAWQQGRLLAQSGQWAGAEKAFARATVAAPQDALYWTNLANAKRHLGDFDGAVDRARHALALAPTDPMALQILGESLGRLHQYAQAAQAFEALEASGHAAPGAMLQHACMLRDQLRPHEAVPVLLRALALQPHLVRGHALLADVLRNMGLKSEAVECMRTVLALEPGHLEALSHLSFEKRHLCDWGGWEEDLAQIRAALDRLPHGANVAPRAAATLGLLSLPLSPAQHLAAARGEARLAQVDVQPMPALTFTGPGAHRPSQDAAPARVRVGWLSFDLREHPVAQLLVQTWEEIDRTRFEVLLYSTGPDDSSVLRGRLQAAADRFVDLRGMSDQQAAERIRADGVQLLIDLNGHTRGQRMGILARRPAPVQAAYLGYPGSTGADFIDYVIGDPLVTPLQDAGHYSEKIAQLPTCLQPNGRWRPLPQPMTRAAAGLPASAFVICAFNHPYKISPQVFDIWCAVLREAPGAVLWLKRPHPAVQHKVTQEAAARGVAPAQLVFADTVSYADHFSRLALADVFADTWPYNAHTTASDALWAGVPVLTRCGDTYASRVATSVLQAAGLGDLAFQEPADYLLALRAMAADPPVLAPYRAHLQQQRDVLPLFDCARHTQELQALFLRMVQRWEQGLAPEHLGADGSDLTTPGVSPFHPATV